MVQTTKIRHFIFLKDVFLIAWTAFGGPQAHWAMFYQKLVLKRGYISEDTLIELNALCQLLPGPSSTQTITAIGYRIGGLGLAILTLAVWIFPALVIMTSAAIVLSYLQAQSFSLEFTRFIQPMAIGFISFAALRIGQKVIKTKTAFLIMLLSAGIAFFYHQPLVFPALIVGGGLLTTFRYRQYPRQSDKNIRIKWHYLTLFIAFFVLVGLLSELSGRWLPFRLLENFYRTGSLIFGGGQVLIPLMFTEFVRVKKLLEADEFLSGYAFSQMVPGPTFCFAVFVGALCMREYGLAGEVAGALIASVGVFLPGTLLIFFVIQFWDELKKYRVVRASLEGINATSSGLVLAAAFLLLMPIVEQSAVSLFWDIFIMISTFLLLQFSRVAPPLIVLAGLLLGLLLS